MDLLLKTFQEKSSISSLKIKVSERILNLNEILLKSSKNRENIEKNLEESENLLKIIENQEKSGKSLEICAEEWFNFYFFNEKNLDKNIKNLHIKNLKVNSTNSAIATKIYQKAQKLPWIFTENSPKNQENKKKLIQIRNFVIFSKIILDEKLEKTLKQIFYVIPIYREILEDPEKFSFSSINHLKKVSELILNKILSGKNKFEKINFSAENFPEFSSFFVQIQENLNLLENIIKDLNKIIYEKMQKNEIKEEILEENE